jgi:2-C-methyl-D-erythritol 4-phosphate cytidylyltransferase
MANNYALIPAAGSGSRMGTELPKQYLPLLGKPLIHHTLSLFAMHPHINRVFVVLSPDDARWLDYPHTKVSVLRCGGTTRAATVLNGLQAMTGMVDAEDWVLVHDAARPCLSPAMLDRLLTTLCHDAVGGLLATPLADTLKRAGVGDRVAATEPRQGLWQAQTPQMFRHALLTRALQAAGTEAPTDESQAVEQLGLSPQLVPGGRDNLKVTFPEDLEMARLILQARQSS